MPGISRGYLGKKPFIYLPLVRVKEKRAPYVHEIVHKIVHQSIQAFWLQEGYASFVQTAVVARYGGYDTTASNPDRRDVHQLARNALKSDVAKIVLPLIGVNGTPSKLSAERREVYRPILEDRRITAPAFYNLSISFVTFLVDKVGLKKLQKTFASPDTNAEILKITGRETADGKADWLRALPEEVLGDPMLIIMTRVSPPRLRAKNARIHPTLNEEGRKRCGPRGRSPARQTWLACR